jgi:riboflavin-specific deaminase-like protein
MRRLLPEPATDITVPDLVEELAPWDAAPLERPFVYMNFALTLDGESTIGGLSRAIGSDRDTELLVGLRTRCDAVMIGAGTLRAEKYGRVVSDPKKREKRESLGLEPDPLIVIISGRMDFPWDAPIFTEAVGRIVVFTASEEDPPETATPVEVIRHEGRVDLNAALAHLRAEENVRALLCEGGATLHGELHKAGCVDEIFISHAPKLAGGRGPGLVEGLDPHVRELELVWLFTEPETGELFARYRMASGT